MAESYWELLKRPEWQRKRLEVMQRDGFACRECKATDKTLNVHHRHYEKGKKPWEYENAVFVTLCEDCHAYRTAYDHVLKAASGRLNTALTATLCGYCFGLVMIQAFDQRGDNLKAHITIDPALADEFAQGLADAYDLTAAAVREACDSAGVIDHKTLVLMRLENPIASDFLLTGAGACA